MEHAKYVKVKDDIRFLIIYFTSIKRHITTVIFIACIYEQGHVLQALAKTEEPAIKWSTGTIAHVPLDTMVKIVKTVILYCF